ADASPLIGTAHAMRCLTLANELRRTGAEALFVCRQLPAPLHETIVEAGHRVAMLPITAEPGFRGAPAGPRHSAWLGVDEALDAAETLAALRTAGAWDWLVVDHYAI